jgi:hypothetical protein
VVDDSSREQDMFEHIDLKTIFFQKIFFGKMFFVSHMGFHFLKKNIPILINSP